jgi:pimeloyl-ACP methyl ester carboxylesterase
LVVVPGYFGSSRHGPYGLYNRLARSWAEAGYRTITVDPLGSGDSSDVARTFSAEVHSVVGVALDMMNQYRRIILVGHSLGTATVLAAREDLRDHSAQVSVWGLAPLVSFEDTGVSFFSEQQLTELAELGATTRHGLTLMRSFIEEAERAWVDLRGRLDASWVGDADPYMTPEVVSRLPQQNLFAVHQADHNFSVTGNVEQLTADTLRLLASYDT